MELAEIIAVAKRTIQMEAAAVAGMEASLDESFARAISEMVSSRGRLVVSGIGKSAIVAQKIVATLNSTGTPSLFMHAADAIHGDLGMIKKDDVVMLISKSGNSPEIKVLVPLIKDFGNMVIGMVGQRQSFLAIHADIVLDTTVEQEACPNNLAPTSSTTAQMVMGDAVAICLMEAKGFGSTDFAKYHPGGNLGKKLYLKVNDLSKLNPKPAVSVDADIKDVIIEITKNRLGATAVLDDQSNIAGIITDGDLRRMLEKNHDYQSLKASDIMSRTPKKIFSTSLAVDAFELMKNENISQLIVMNSSDEYAGILHLHDLVREGII
jgi:arabinose-5-phosphate isomerase